VVRSSDAPGETRIARATPAKDADLASGPPRAPRRAEDP
jgi:hypothetical protein